MNLRSSLISLVLSLAAVTAQTGSAQTTDAAGNLLGNAPFNSGETYILSLPPTLSNVNPSTGVPAGGTSVTLSGTNFTGATSVTFGGATASSLSVTNATTLTCVTPAHAVGAVSVLVTTPGGTNGANTLFTYVAPPQIPLTLVGGSLTIDGSGSPGAANLILRYVTGVGGPFLEITDTSRTLGAPAGGTQVNGNTVRIPISSLTGGITLTGSSLADMVTLDFTGGDICPPGGINFNGGAPTTSPGDVLAIDGDFNSGGSYGTGSPGAGVLTLDTGNTVNFTGLEPVDMSAASFTDFTVTVDPTAAFSGNVITTVAAVDAGVNTEISFGSSGLESAKLGVITGTLTIQGDNLENDFFQLQGLGSAMAGHFVVDGRGGDSDVIEVNNTTLTVAGLNKNLSLKSDFIGLGRVNAVSPNDNPGVIVCSGNITLEADGDSTVVTPLWGASGVWGASVPAHFNSLQLPDTSRGSIQILGDIKKTAGADAALLLKGKHSVLVLNTTAASGTSPAGSIVSTSNKINTTLHADSDASGAGNVMLMHRSVVTTNGGTFTIGGGADPTTSPAMGIAGATTTSPGVSLVSTTITTAGGAVNIRGQGAASSGGIGVLQNVFAGSVNNLISTGAGNLTLIGTGGSNTTNTHGFFLLGNATAPALTSGITTTSGNISINGAAGGGTNDFARISTLGSITSGSGNINFTAPVSDQSFMMNPAASQTASISSTSGNITIRCEKMNLNGGAGTESISTGSGNEVNLRVATGGVSVDLGSTVDNTAGTLELSTAELDNITAGTLRITSAATINVSAIIAPSAFTTLAFDPVVGTTFAATGGFTADVTSASVFEKMTAKGTVGITAGAALTLNSAGGYIWNGTDAFTLIANDNADAITGTFTGPTLTNFLGSTRTAQQSYSGGDGNDLVLSQPTASVASLTRQSTNPSKNASVTWQIVFSQPVSSLTAANFALIQSGGVTGASLNAPTETSGPPSTTWNITASTGTGDGTLGLNFANDTNLSHDVTTTLPFTGEVYTIDKTAPVFTSLTRQTPSTQNTNADTLVFRATLSEAVSNLNDADFTVTGTTATITNITGTGPYDITVSGGNLASLSGNVSLDLAGGQDITDLATNVLPGTAPATNQTYTVDNAVPTVALTSTATDPAPNAAIPVTVTFNEIVTGFDLADITVTGGSKGNFAGSGANYTFDLTPSGPGVSVTADIAANAAQDAAGNNSTAASQFTRNVLDAVSIAATTDTAIEGGTTGLYTFTRAVGTGDLTVNFQLDGSSTATAATDFNLTSSGTLNFTPGTGAGSIVIPNGQTSATVTLTALTETVNAAEAAETARLNVVAASGYIAGASPNATVTITENSFLVTTTADSGPGSLRQAVLNANSLAGADTITFSDGTGGTGNFTDSTLDTITLASGQLTITTNATVQGTGARKLAVSGNNASRVFQVDTGATVRMTGLTVTSGSDGSNNGGGILNLGTLVVLDAAITGNAVTGAGLGGGLSSGDAFTTGAVTTVVNSTISGNSSGGGGGGVHTASSNSLTLINCTLSGNSASSGFNGGAVNANGTTTILNSTISGNNTGNRAGGVIVHGATLTISNSIVAGNTAEINRQPDVLLSAIGGTVLTSNGGNLIGNGQDTINAVTWAGSDLTGTNASPINPQLAALADNGGPTNTMALLSGSQALNNALTANIPADTFDLDGDTDTLEPTPFDQRGTTFTRAIGTVDIGAFELQKAVSIADLAAISEGNSGTTNFTFTITRTGDTSGAVNMTYTVSGAAVNAADFGGTLPTGTATITNGNTTTTVSIPVSGDLAAELNEAFTVTLSAPDNGYVISGAPATSTINNDDALTVTINQATAQADPTNASTINYTVVFSEAVTDFDDVADVTLSGTTTPTTAVITGGPTTYNVALSGMTGSGTAIATIPASSVLSAGGVANAASTSTDNTVTRDITAPALASAILISDTTLKIGDTATVTFTFTEAITGFTAADVSVANAALTNLSSSNGGITWTATLTPSSGITDTSNILTLDNTGYTDLVGNAGTGTSDSGNYAIDTVRPALASAIAISDTALKIGDTATVTFSFTEAVTDFTTADVSVPNAVLTGLTSGDGGITWMATLTPDSSVTDTTNLLTLDLTGLSDLNGNTGASSTDSPNYAIDTARPTVGIVVADSTLTIGETSLVTFTFSEAVSGFTNADLTVPNGNLTSVSSVDGNITWTATFTPNVIIAATNVITLDNTGVTDAAGNAGTGTTDSNNYAIDITTVSIAANDPDADENATGTGSFRVTRNGTSGALTVNLAIAASSTAADTDWTQSGATFSSLAPNSTGAITIPDGSTFADITLTPTTDLHAEAAETVRLNIAPDAAYVTGSPDNATVTIGQNDFVVINTNDAGEGTLRQAVLNANAIVGNDTITFDATAFATPQTITLTTGDLAITQSAVIQGAGAQMLSINGDANNRIFDIFSAAVVSLYDLTVTNGFNQGGFGGAITVRGSSIVTVQRCVVSNSRARILGGGIYVDNSILNVVSSTLSGNTGTDFGGGAIAGATATVRIINSTITGNTGPSGGALHFGGSPSVSIVQSTITNNTTTTSEGGVTADSSNVTVSNSIIAANLNNTTMPDVSGSFTSGGGNVIGNVGTATGFTGTNDLTSTGAAPINPLIGTLSNNGGSTLTHLPLNGSPAINNGLVANLPTDAYDLDVDTITAETLPVDQRGGMNLRQRGPAPDAGAVEAFAFEPTLTAANTDEDTLNSSGLVITANTADGSLTTHYQITGILNGTLYQNDGITAILSGDFITKNQGAAGLKFLPGANLHDGNTSIFGFSAQAAVGTNGADLRGTPQSTFVTVNSINDVPTVVDAGLDDETMTIGANRSIPLTPHFTDLDGDTLTFTIQSNGNSSIAKASVLGNNLKLSALDNGVTTITVEASDGLGGTVTDSLTVFVGTNTATAKQPFKHKIKVNNGNGLFEVSVQITNTTPQPLKGFRLHVDFDSYRKKFPSLRLENADSPSKKKNVYVDYEKTVAVDGNAVIKLQFYTKDRKFPVVFKPIYTMTPIKPIAKATGLIASLATTSPKDAAKWLAGGSRPFAAQINSPQAFALPDGSVQTQFPVIKGRWYRVSYSTDQTHWTNCPKLVQATSHNLYWTDSGPPNTATHPAGEPIRFYRLHEITAP